MPIWKFRPFRRPMLMATLQWFRGFGSTDECLVSCPESRFPCWVRASSAGSFECLAKALRLARSNINRRLPSRHWAGPDIMTSALPISVPTTLQVTGIRPHRWTTRTMADMRRLLSRQWAGPVACLATLKPSVHCR